jgi:hypothetical protein
MRAPTGSELLNAWECARTNPPALRAAGMLGALAEGTSVQESVDAIASLSLGERDQRLLALREWTFGPTLASVANCPSCGELLEWTLQASDLRAPDVSGDAAEQALSVDVAQYRVQFRLPNSHDLAAVADAGDPAHARELLLARCLLPPDVGGSHSSRPDVDALPPSVRDAISERMAQADPQGDTSFDLTCPRCQHFWRVVFDIESFFWSELSAWAERVLLDVHTLACTYGWSERDILDMSPWRRQFYLGLIGV